MAEYSVTELELPNPEGEGTIIVDLKDLSAASHIDDAKNPVYENIGLYKFAISPQRHVAAIRDVEQTDIASLGFYTAVEVDKKLAEAGTLPEVSTDDNGKVLKVVNGVWDKGDASAAGLPEVTVADNKKVLQVVEGKWDKADLDIPPAGTDVTELTKAEYDALSEEEKQEDKFYVLTDYVNGEYIGSEDNRGLEETILCSIDKLALAVTTEVELIDSINNYDLIMLETLYDNNIYNTNVFTLDTFNSRLWKFNSVTFTYTKGVGASKVLDNGTKVQLYNFSNVVCSVRIIGLKFKAKVYKPENVYSLEERKIGKWIDGRSLYQKTIVTSELSTGAHAINHNILNIDNICYFEFFITRDDTDYIWTPYSNIHAANISQSAVLVNSINRTVIEYYLGTTRTSSTYHLTATIRYTKTTD